MTTDIIPPDGMPAGDASDGEPASTIDPEAFGLLASFLSEHRLTEHIAAAEFAFDGAAAEDCMSVADAYGLSTELLAAALSVRSVIGRLNDVVHATTIARVLPLILEPDEVLTNRPSLGAGNDPSRPYDIETNRRVAEFKVAGWKGADTMRQRGAFADLVHLALDKSGRRAQLYVLGDRPARFLTTSNRTPAWALERSSQHLRDRFSEEFGDAANYTIASFTSGPAIGVEIVDLETVLPTLSGAAPPAAEPGLPEGVSRKEASSFASGDKVPLRDRLSQVATQIPVGAWTTYGDIAAMIGSHALPVGTCLSTWPIPNAHRIMNSKGQLSAGFQWHDGRTEDPVELLKSEEIRFSAQGRADPSQRWHPHDI